MALPLPRVVADVGPGGGLVTAMGGINKLHNDMLLRKINEVKAQYAPLTTKAEAASKLAYANLLGPQFLAKLLGNTGALGNLSEDQKRNILGTVYSAGTGQGSANNTFSQIQNESMGPGERLGNSLSDFVTGHLKKIFGSHEQPTAEPQFSSQSNETVIPQNNAMPSRRPKGGVSLEGQQWYDENGNPVYGEEVQESENPAMQLELRKGQRTQRQPTYAENEGNYKGTVKQLEEEGKYRAAALKQVGESQLGLSHSGAVLDRMTGIIKNPVFTNMRNKIPGFQSKQLDYLKVMGTPEEKELIGDFLSTGESFIASTVQGFSGKPLVREFDLAQRQKITPHDTVESAIGKLQSATALHDIAEKKNQIVSELLQKGYNESDAVKQANKMIDVSAIEKATKRRLQRKIQVRNNKTGVTKMVTLEEARKMGVPNV